MKNFTKAQLRTLRTLVEDELTRCRKLRKTSRKSLKTWAEMEIMTYEELLEILNEKCYSAEMG